MHLIADDGCRKNHLDPLHLHGISKYEDAKGLTKDEIYNLFTLKWLKTV